MSTDTTAFDNLLSVAQHSLRYAAGLPAQIERRTYWSGVGFELMGERVVVALDDVVETLELPTLTRLPGVQPWVRGVANVRGRLLPITDVAILLGGERRKGAKNRVLVVEQGELFAGLLVDDVFGIQHFPEDEILGEGCENEQLKPFVIGAYAAKDSIWSVCSMGEILSKSNFMSADQRSMLTINNNEPS